MSTGTGAAIGTSTGTVQVHFGPVTYRSGQWFVEWGKLLLVVSVLAAVIGGGWGGWAWWEANRDLDVTSRARLEGERPTPDGGALTLRFDAPETRSRLKLTLTLAEGRPKSQLCLPHTSVEIRSATGTGPTVTALNGVPAMFPLPDDGSVARLQLTVRTERGCVMDVAVAEMILTND
ncbi:MULTISPECIES: hypothetical protein [unclassified Kitasatospora]|uniref:hypothetical protein n=1 Tax=unclassified Kitasatospora TaxID=2633591 RepID=UPI0012FCC22F|nr:MULTISPECIES: hypothetical protein [unclassified Kitasatospora]